MPGSRRAGQPVLQPPLSQSGRGGRAPALAVGRLVVGGLAALIFVVGLALRWSLNGTWRFGPDESLYSFWALQAATGQDVWLAATPGVDKPPVFIYAMALAMKVYGYTEFASRFPSIAAGSLSVLLVCILARRLYGDALATLLAALLLALSPLAILYAATAFTDPLLVLWLLLAAALAAYGHWGWAGVPAALAVLTKQEGLLLLPVVALLQAHTLAGGGLRRAAYRLAPMAAASGGLALLGEGLWEWGRPGQPSSFALGVSHYGGVSLVAPWQWPARLLGWWQVGLQYTFASPALNLLLGLGVAALLLWGRGDERRADASLVLTVLYLLFVRTALSFQVWDRYTLVLAPFLCLLLGRVVAWLWAMLLAAARGPLRPRLLALVAPLALVALLLAFPVAQAVAGRLPVGGDHGRYWGIEETARYLRENAPSGAVVLHHSLGWQFSYYLYGAPLDFWWYPSAQWLAEAMAGRRTDSQYVVLPAGEPAAELAGPLAERGLQLLPVHAAQRPDGSVSFATYRIAPLTDVR